MIPSHEFPAALFFLATYITVDSETRASENGWLTTYIRVLPVNGLLTKLSALSIHGRIFTTKGNFLHNCIEKNYLYTYGFPF
jgi:hypothetical protein